MKNGIRYWAFGLLGLCLVGLPGCIAGVAPPSRGGYGDGTYDDYDDWRERERIWREWQARDDWELERYRDTLRWQRERHREAEWRRDQERRRYLDERRQEEQRRERAIREREQRHALERQHDQERQVRERREAAERQRQNQERQRQAIMERQRRIERHAPAWPAGKPKAWEKPGRGLENDH